MIYPETNLSYAALEKMRQHAQRQLNDFIDANRAFIDKYTQLLNEHMHYTNLANKAMLKEDIKP